ncbi:cysteine-rich CWC family protein [Xanthocytophaga flavus]|uniref:cysteine-rich CWC family protein n=1 Tax=Xanthocytophaga flava TaxID=3048013 RepID=UPI00391F30A2
MEKHYPVECPRCGTSFACKVNSVSKCDCMYVDLTPLESQYIRENTESGTCLCMNCLMELKKAYHQHSSE